MTRRQSEVELAEALVPTNHVRLLWRREGFEALQQVTGLLVLVNDELVHLLPHQNGRGQVRIINRDRIHSAVVTKAGPYLAERRYQASQHLHDAAYAAIDGDTERAVKCVHLAAGLIPGLLPAA